MICYDFLASGFQRVLLCGSHLYLIVFVDFLEHLAKHNINTLSNSIEVEVFIKFVASVEDVKDFVVIFQIIA